MNLFSPVTIGFSVLGMSKWLLGKFWIKMKDIYGDDVRAIQTDTDSIHFKLYNQNFYEKIEQSLNEKR